MLAQEADISTAGDPLSYYQYHKVVLDFWRLFFESLCQQCRIELLFAAPLYQVIDEANHQLSKVFAIILPNYLEEVILAKSVKLRELYGYKSKNFTWRYRFVCWVWVLTHPRYIILTFSEFVPDFLILLWLTPD